MSTGLQYARPRGTNQDGTRTNAGPSFDATANTLLFGGAGNAKSAFLQFPTRLNAAAVVAEAILKVKPAANASAGGLHTVTAYNFAQTGLDATAGAAAVLGTATQAGGAWTAGTWVQYDLTTLVSLALATRNLLTLGLDTDESAQREIYSVRHNLLDGAFLQLKFDWEDTEDNPYTLTLAGLWALLESNPYFAALVPAGNRIKFWAGNRDPKKQNASAADYPEVRIVALTSVPSFTYDSGHASDNVVFQVEMLTGDQRLDVLYYPLKFAIYRALQDNAEAMIRLIRWRGHQICLQTEAVQVSEAVDNDRLNRGVLGWSGLWQIRVPLILPQSEL